MSDQSPTPEGIPPTMPAYTTHPATLPTRVTVVDFDMSFTHLVGFFVKAAFAAIPAAILVAIIVAVLVAVLGGIGSSLHQT